MAKPDAFTKARVGLLLSSPFFGSLLLRYPAIENPSVPTMGVNIKGELHYNKKFANSLNPDELKFILAHEAMHLALAHPQRGKGKDHEAWNYACDAVINEMLISVGVGKFIKGGVRWPGAETMTAEEVYAQLKKGQGQSNAGDEDSEGNGGQGSGKVEAIGNDVNCEGTGAGDPNELSEEQINRATLEGKMAITSAHTAGKGKGAGSSSLNRIVSSIVAKKIPWYEILEQEMNTLIVQGRTWMKPNKRYINHSVYLPRRDKRPHIGTIIIGIDTSGSISDKELSVFTTHINSVIEDCNPEKVHVVFVDSNVAHVDIYEHSDYPVSITKAWGGGGTDMREVVSYADKLDDEDVDAVIIMTDGYTPFPTEEPGYLLVWAMTTREKAPVGTVLHIEV